MKNIIINGKATQEKLELAKHFRKNLTPSEAKLWERLRANRLSGLHFRRQQVILGFIVDFYCHKYQLIVEINGSIHDKREDYDLERENILRKNGFYLIRFTNDQVDNSLEKVLSEIQNSLKKITPKITSRNS